MKYTETWEGKVRVRDYGNGMVERILVNPPEPVKQPLSRLAIYELFTDAELAGIFASTEPAVMVLLEKIKAADTIHLDDPRFVAGVNALETTFNLLAAGRAAEILGA